MIKIGIVGGTGYTGVELLRILAQHPQAQLVAITSRKEAGMAGRQPNHGSVSLGPIRRQ
jgi:N-acetyl-gamma-glutamyl-phosphate reductase